jgi:pyruvate/2-oxoglutarate dehydrogenase complex dihydrolipoamide dehydrogenase (E3) component
MESTSLLSGWINPRPAQLYHLVVLGGGPAGVLAATEAARRGAKVALVERNRLGGVSLNSGCVPSKALIRSARVCADIRRAEDFGVRGNLKLGDFQPDFSFAMARAKEIRTQLAREIAPGELKEKGIDVFSGEGKFLGNRAVEIGALTLRFRKALIATGARTSRPLIPGIEEAGYLTSNTIYDLQRAPQRLLVIGGGPLGCEFAQTLQRLGSQVTIVQKNTLFLPNEERDAAQLLSDSFARDGMHIRLNTEVIGVRAENGMRLVDVKERERTTTIIVDEILAGVGRVPNVENLGLKKAGVSFDAEHGIHVNDYLRSTNRNIYAAGDVCSPFKYSHIADAQARIAVENALFFGRQRFSSVVIPWCTYTDPEVAHVGVYVRDARAAGMPIKSFTIPMHEVDRAIVDGEIGGFVKVHVREGTDKILGATVVAKHAGEMINELTLAMQAGLSLCEMGKVIHSYPTQAEAIRMAADAYLKTRFTGFRKRLTHFWLRTLIK